MAGNTRYIENKLNDDRVIAVNFQPMADGGWVAIHHDITERKKTERALVDSTDALKKSNARFAAALQNMSQGLCMIDAEQRILVANERYRQIYNLSEDLVKPGTTLSRDHRIPRSEAATTTGQIRPNISRRSFAIRPTLKSSAAAASS